MNPNTSHSPSAAVPVTDDYLIDHFGDAIRRRCIRPVYQPIVRTATMAMCGIEALARWQDPAHGTISPAVFIPVLEKNHLIHELDSVIAERIADDYDTLRKNGFETVPISINLSRYDFDDADMFHVIEQICQRHNIPHGMIRIEVKEDAFLAQPEALRKGLEHFHEAGFSLWLDDFGRGYSSLKALKDYPFEALKFDMSFIRTTGDIRNDTRARIILSYMINMAKSLRIGTLTEGVENSEEFTFLRHLGCGMVQGYLIGRPKSLEEMIADPLPAENPGDAEYYEKIDAVRIERSGEITPDKNTSSPSDLSLTVSRQTRVGHAEPMAVMELQGTSFHHLFSNQAFEKAMRRLGLASPESYEAFLNHRTGILQEKLRVFSERLKAGETNVRLTFEIHGVFMDLSADYIAANPDTGAVAFLLCTSSHQQEGRDRLHDFDDAMAAVYSLTDRIDLVSVESGRILNSYVNTARYGSVHEGQLLKPVIAGFADRCIPEEDRERFLAFLDPATLTQRLARTGKSSLSASFNTIMEDGAVLPKRYRIMPVFQEGQPLLLLMIADPD